MGRLLTPFIVDVLAWVVGLVAVTDDEKFVTVATAAARLQVCRETVRRWIKKGYLPASRYPGGFKIRVRDLENIQSTFVYTRQHPA